MSLTKQLSELDLAIKAAKLAGQVHLKYFNSGISFFDKGDSDIVTKADIEADKVIHETLIGSGHAYYSEESKGQIAKDMWIVDPLDGTNNFWAGLPMFSATITLVRNDVLQLSVMYYAATDELLVAENGKGVFLDGRRIEAGKVKTGCASFIRGYKSKALPPEGYSRVFTNWAPSVDFLLLARSKTDSIIASETEPYDILGGVLLAQELGCMIINGNGKIWRFEGFSEEMMTLTITR